METALKPFRKAPRARKGMRLETHERIASRSIAAVLESELARRRARNSKYSLRAFAAHMGLSPSFLSKLMSGKRPITAKTLAKISERLALPSDIVASVNLNGPSFQSISLDQFQFIADWYHFAILELVTVKDFDSSPVWIATKLGISELEAQEAVERLIRLAFLERSHCGNLRLLSPDNTTIGPSIATPATRKQQAQLLEKAIDAIESTPFEKRSQTSVTLAISEERLGEARDIIAEFRRKMASVLQRPGARDSVYQLTISFYPLTPPNPS